MIEIAIPLKNIRAKKTDKEARILEVVLVFNGKDRWNTIIDPTGLVTRPSTVVVDYNHNQVDTGAYVENIRVVKNYETEEVNGEVQILEEALIGDVVIPKTAKMFYMDGKKKLDNGSLYDAIEDGHIKSFSVEFLSVEEEEKDGVITYKQWDLTRLSALDITPGQPQSGYKIIRSCKNGCCMYKRNLTENKEKSKPNNMTDKSTEKVKDTEKTVEEPTKRYIGQTVKSKDGKFGVVVAETNTTDSQKSTVKLTDGTTVETGEIGWYDKKGEFEFTEATTSELLISLFSDKREEEIKEEIEEPEEEIEEKRTSKIDKLSEQVRILTEQVTKLQARTVSTDEETEEDKDQAEEIKRQFNKSPKQAKSDSTTQLGDSESADEEKVRKITYKEFLINQSKKK